MCDCVNTINKNLEEHNAKILQAILLPLEGSNSLRSRVLIRTGKLDSKKRAALPDLMASYCPFCGLKES